MRLLMRYAAARFEEFQRAEAYRFYCSSALKCIAENTRNFASGTAPDKTLYDILNGKTIQDKTPEDIIADVIAKGGLIEEG